MDGCLFEVLVLVIGCCQCKGVDCVGEYFLWEGGYCWRDR